MENEERIKLVADMLRQTEEANQRAHVAVKGEKPEWVHWYARLVVVRLNQMLDKEWDESDVERLFMEAERRRMDEGAEDWPDYYANFLSEQP